MTNSQNSNSSGPQKSNDMMKPHRYECKLIANLDLIEKTKRQCKYLVLYLVKYKFQTFEQWYKILSKRNRLNLGSIDDEFKSWVARNSVLESMMYSIWLIIRTTYALFLNLTNKFSERATCLSKMKVLLTFSRFWKSSWSLYSSSFHSHFHQSSRRRWIGQVCDPCCFSWDLGN